MLITTTPAAAAAAAHAHRRITFPSVRPALLKVKDYATALLYRYIRARIEAECGGPARLVRRPDSWV